MLCQRKDEYTTLNYFSRLYNSKHNCYIRFDSFSESFKLLLVSCDYKKNKHGLNLLNHNEKQQVACITSMLEWGGVSCSCY